MYEPICFAIILGQHLSIRRNSFGEVPPNCLQSLFLWPRRRAARTSVATSVTGCGGSAKYDQLPDTRQEGKPASGEHLKVCATHFEEHVLKLVILLVTWGISMLLPRSQRCLGSVLVLRRFTFANVWLIARYVCGLHAKIVVGLKFVPSVLCQLIL